MDLSNINWQITGFRELSVMDFHDLAKARSEIFVVEQNCPYLDLDGFDPVAVHIWAKSEEGILAYCRVFEPGIKYEEASLGRVITTHKARGKGLGKLLMQIAMETIENRLGANSIRISAQDYLLKFYGDLGFRETGKKYLEDNIPHSEMIWQKP